MFVKKPKYSLTVITFAFCMCFALQTAFTDILYLKGGGRIVGVVTETENGYRIKSGKSSMSFSQDRVMKLTKCPLPEEQYPIRLKAIDENSAESHYILGLWCRANDLEEKAQKHFIRATELNPTFDDAWKQAGFKKLQGRWYHADDYMKLQGYEKYDGKWVKKNDIEKLKQEDEKKARAKYIRDTTNRIFRILRKEPEKLSLTETSVLLAKMADNTPDKKEPAVVTMLRRYAIDSNSNCRLLAITSLGYMDNQYATKILCLRSKQEGHEKVLSAIASGLAASKYREEVLLTLLAKLDGCEFPRHVKRLVFCLHTLGSGEIIPELISRLDSTAIEVKQQKPDNSKKLEEFLKKQNADMFGENGNQNTKISIGGFSKKSGKFSKEPFYPNYEALKILTGKDFGRDREKWSKWWEVSKENFYFAPGEKVTGTDNGKED